MTLALAMIVKDEEELLARCLDSCRELFDEIIIVDTGSTDRTVEIAERYGVVHHFPWIDDFAAARNFAFSKVQSSEWVMWLDADDILHPEDLPAFQEMKSQLVSNQPDYVQIDYWYAHFADGSARTIVPTDRIVRRSSGFPWCEVVHECLSIPYTAKRMRFDGAPIHHHPTEAGMKADQGRNLRIMARAMEAGTATPRIKFYYGKELFELGRFEECLAPLMQYTDGANVMQYQMEAMWRIADAHYGLKQGDEARKYALSAVRIHWQWVQPYLTLTRLCLDAKVYDEAIFWARTAVSIPIAKESFFQDMWQSKVLPRSLLSLGLGWSGQYEEANQVNQELLAMMPDDPGLLLNVEIYADQLGIRRPPRDRPLRLNLGCGNKRRVGFWNCDLNGVDAVDEVFSMDTLPYGPESVDSIFSEHALEHLDGQAARKALKDWGRVLKPGGELHLKLPDLAECCKAYVNAETPEERTWYRHTIYGYQESLWGEPDDGQFHKTGFYKREMVELLDRAGLVVQSIANYDGYRTPSMEVRATKARSLRHVDWVCPAEEDAVQARLRVLQVARAMRLRGYFSRIVERTDQVTADLVVVSNPYVIGSRQQVEKWRQQGKRVAADLCEDLFDLQPAMADDLKVYDVVICSSHVLAQKCRDVGAVALTIEDVMEVPEGVRCRYGRRGRLKVVWTGYGGGKGLAEEIRPTIESLGMELVTIHEHVGATHPWSRDTWPGLMADCDIAISPADPVRSAKGQVKAVQAMGLGLPTIVGPLDSYLRLVKDRVTGLVARNPEDWGLALRRLQDPVLRQIIGTAGRLKSQAFSPEATADRWWAVLDALEPTTTEVVVAYPVVDMNPDDDTASVVVTTFNCLEYTQICIDSLRKCRGTVPYKIFIADAGSSDGTQDWVKSQDDLTLLGGERRRCFSEAVNLGFRATRSKYVVVLNNDLVVSPGWLDEMARVAKTQDMGCVGVLSNCDRGWLYSESDEIAQQMQVNGVPLVPKMRIGSVDVEAVMEWGGRSNQTRKGEVVEREWVAFYATLFTRGAIDATGELDEEFKTGCEDVDYCMRLQRQGYRIGQAHGSFVFHWGAVSREHDEGSRYDEYHQEDSVNQARLTEKQTKPHVVIYTGPAYERWTPLNINGGGIGGSETCAAYLAYWFARKGWRVAVVGDCAGLEGPYGDEDGMVQYYDHSQFERYIQQNWIDLFISSRTVDTFRFPIRAGVKAVWIHDIFIGPDPAMDIRSDVVDVYAALSPWHSRYLLEHHKELPEEKIWVVPDGVDVSRFDGTEERNPHRMIWSSSPDRGLLALLVMFPRIRKRVPDAELHIYYGFNNWDKAVAARNDPVERQHHSAVKQGLEQEGIHVHGRIGQDELAREFMKTGVWGYSSLFWETHCITAVEAMLAGCNIVSTYLAGLETTVGYDHGVLLPPTMASYLEPHASYADPFIDTVVKMMLETQAYEEVRMRARKHAEQFDWSRVADLWVEKYQELVRGPVPVAVGV